MTWKSIDPIVYRQGWDAAIAGKTRSACDYFGAGPRAAWNEGYDDALAERLKEPPASERQREPLCEREGEPSDDELYNGPGIEGGIPYGPR